MFLGAKTQQQVFAHYVEKTQRFLLDPDIAYLLRVVEDRLLRQRTLTGAELTTLLDTASRNRET